MKKIILALIISLFLVNFSFANEEKNYCKFFDFLGEEREEKIFEKYKSCNKDEKIIDLYEENGNYVYFVYEFNYEKGINNLKLFYNEKMIFEKNIKNLNIAIKGGKKVYFSKYGNHILSYIGHSEEVPEDKKQEAKKVSGYYIDDKKVLDIIDNQEFDAEITKKLLDTNFEITYDIKDYSVTFYLNGKGFSGFDLKYSSIEEIEIYQKVLKLTNSWGDYDKDNRRAYKESHNNEYFLSKKQRERLDNILKKFLENKENFSKIDEIIEKIKYKQYFYIRNSIEFETYDYIKSELKIFKLKKS